MHKITCVEEVGVRQPLLLTSGLNAVRMRSELKKLMLDVDAFVAAHPDDNHGLPSISDLPEVPTKRKGKSYVMHVTLLCHG